METQYSLSNNIWLWFNKRHWSFYTTLIFNMLYLFSFWCAYTFLDCSLSDQTKLLLLLRSWQEPFPHTPPSLSHSIVWDLRRGNDTLPLLLEMDGGCLLCLSHLMTCSSLLLLVGHLRGMYTCQVSGFLLLWRLFCLMQPDLWEDVSTAFLSCAFAKARWYLHSARKKLWLQSDSV